MARLLGERPKEAFEQHVERAINAINDKINQIEFDRASAKE